MARRRRGRKRLSSSTASRISGANSSPSTAAPASTRSRSPAAATATPSRPGSDRRERASSSKPNSITKVATAALERQPTGKCPQHQKDRRMGEKPAPAPETMPALEITAKLWCRPGCGGEDQDRDCHPQRIADGTAARRQEEGRRQQQVGRPGDHGPGSPTAGTPAREWQPARRRAGAPAGARVRRLHPTARGVERPE